MPIARGRDGRFIETGSKAPTSAAQKLAEHRWRPGDRDKVESASIGERFQTYKSLTSPSPMTNPRDAVREMLRQHRDALSGRPLDWRASSGYEAFTNRDEDARPSYEPKQPPKRFPPPPPNRPADNDPTDPFGSNRHPGGGSPSPPPRQEAAELPKPKSPIPERLQSDPSRIRTVHRAYRYGTGDNAPNVRPSTGYARIEKLRAFGQQAAARRPTG